MKRLLLLGLALAATACSERTGERAPDAAAPPVAAVSGTQRMTERLRVVLAEADPAANITVYGQVRADRFREQIENATEVHESIGLQMRLGHELLNDAKTEESIRQLRTIERFFARPEVHPSPAWVSLLREYLGLAHLRLGEQDNCIDHHTPESCLMPVRGRGVHTITRGSQTALGYLTLGLRDEPDNLRLRWLLNLAYMTLGQYPDRVPEEWLIPPAVFESDADIGRFPDVAMDAGVDIIGLAGGVVMDDFDEDGFVDLLVSDWGLDKQMRLLRSEGDGSFTDRTEEAGLLGEIGGLNMVHTDYDNDGHVDVLVLRGAWLGDDGRHPNSLLKGRGDGTFEDVTEEAGLLSAFPTQAGTWADYDGDGWVDLFIGNESGVNGRHPCQLYHNNGDGTFTDVAASCGVNHVGFVKGATWGDFDGDGRPDLYLSAFGQRNVLFRNEGPADGGAWRFRDVTAQAGVADPSRSFPTWFFDYDNDGDQDLLVAPFAGFNFSGVSVDIVAADYLGETVQGSRTALYRNEGDGTFTDVAPGNRIDAAMLAMGANFGDVDNDGFLDCYIGTGDPYLGTLVPNRMFLNVGGTTFRDITTSGGFGHVQKGHGIAFGDLDNDGDQDIYAVMGGSHAGDFYQNALFANPGHGNRWVTLRLEGTRSNRAAIGARVRVVVRTPSGSRDVHVTVGTGGSFGSSTLQQEIGLGNAVAIERVEVRWPVPGSVQTFTGVPLDRFVLLREGDADAVPLDVPVFELPTPSGM